MRLNRQIAIAGLAVLVLGAGSAHAQFGKNKISYEDFDWKVYESEHFNFFYYEEEEKFLPKVSGMAESSYEKLSGAFKHDIEFKIPIIFYKTHGEFEQTNIELNFLPESVGAFAEPIRNRMVVPIDQPDEKLRALIAHELTHIFEYDILFASDLGRIIRARPPLWLMEGLASHMAKDEDTLDIMVIRDAVVTEKVPDIFDQRQLSFLTYRFGQAAFDFIEAKWGMDGINDLLLEYRNRITKDIEEAVEEAFEMKPDEFNDAFRKYLRDKYLPYLVEKDDPSDYGREIGLKGPYIFTMAPAVSPSGELVAVLTNKYREEIDLVLISAKDGTVFKNLTRGFTNRYEYIVNKYWEGKRDVSWSPSGDEIAFFGRRENKKLLFIVGATTGRVIDKVDVGVDEVQSPAFSPDGRKVLFAGNKEGIFDVFLYDRDTGKIDNVTQDDHYDANPMWFPSGESIVYQSKVGGVYDKIFTFDLTTRERTQLTYGAWNDIQPVVTPDGQTIYFSSDETGIYNLISYELGAEEYRQYTDVVGGNFSPIPLAGKEGKTRLAFGSFFEGRYRLYEMDLAEPLRVARIDPGAGMEEAQADYEPLDVRAEDTQKYSDVKLTKRFHIDDIYVEAGITDDGTILSNSVISISDLLGNQRFFFRLQSVDRFSNLDIVYLNVKRRWNWGVRAFDFRDFFYVPGEGDDYERERIFRESGAIGFLSYPLNKFHRIETGIGYIDREIDYGPFGFDITEEGSLDEEGVLTDNYPFATVSLVGDTTRFKSFGPHHGRRYDLTLRYAPSSLGSSRGFTDAILDFRNYQKMTLRSLIAVRLFAAISDSDTPNLFSFGGEDTLRGYDFRELVGSRAAYMNVELRFPFVDELRFGFGLALRQIRGKIFFDTGLAYFEDDDIDLWVDDDDGFRLVDLKASVGVGFGFDIGPVELNWTFARRTDLSEFGDETRSAFYIGRSF